MSEDKDLSLRLLILTGEFPDMVGGVADHSARLAECLVGLGHQVEVLTAADPRVKPVPGVVVRPLVRTWQGSELAARCRESQPDVVLVQYSPYLYQSLGLPVGLVRALASLRQSFPVALIAHELFIPWGGPRLLPLWIGQRLVAATAIAVCQVTVVSTERRQKQLGRAGVPRRKLALVRIGPSLRLDEESRSEAELEGPGDVFRIGMFSSLALHWRRPDLVVEAVRRMGAGRPSSRLRLTLMGRVQDDTASYLRSVPLAGPGYELEVTGVLPREEAARRLSHCHVAVLFDQSGVGGISTRSTSVATALALHRPLLANRGLETDDLFQDGVNVLFSPLSVEAVQASLERLRDDHGLRRRLSAGAATLHQTHLSWEVVAASFDRLCRSLANPGLAPSATPS